MRLAFRAHTGRTVLASREPEMRRFIPYEAHVSDHVVKTALGDYVQVFRLAGASFESADDVQLNSWHERLNVLWRNIASPHVALWTHVVRQRERIMHAVGEAEGFADALAHRYLTRLAGETLMVNELYVALIYRPVVGAPAGLLARLLSRGRGSAPSLEMRDAIDACEKLARTLEASLARYEPECLSVYRRGGQECSRLLEFLSLLLRKANDCVST